MLEKNVFISLNWCLVLSYLACNNCGNVQDILPFNYTRVPLSDYPGVPGSDYINANYIKGQFTMFGQFLGSCQPVTHRKRKVKMDECLCVMCLYLPFVTCIHSRHWQVPYLLPPHPTTVKDCTVPIVRTIPNGNSMETFERPFLFLYFWSCFESQE